MEDNKDYFCNKPLKPWLILIVSLTAFLIIWMIIQREEIVINREMEGPGVRQNLQPPKGEPIFPGPMKSAALSDTYLSKHYGVAAITKATPRGGVQLVANPSHVEFQNALKDAVNSVIPTVCDIHAVWVNRSGYGIKATNPNSIGFLQPFDGKVDKFIQNRGYENIGAGLLVDSAGYILTNHHVIQNAKEIIVTVPGDPSRDYSAVLVSHDVKKDLALIKIKARTIFPEARLGDSSFCQIGDYVIAMGSPFGMEQTVTSGIISGIRKSVNVDNVRYKNLLQTDAPINRGSSGGPLVDLSGEVIGITTAIYAPTGVFNGTGFAIPINDAKAFLSSSLGKRYSVALSRKGILKDGITNANNAAIESPMPVQFGIEAISVDPIIAEQMGLNGGSGILVNTVFEGSPASIAGIERGDIIIAIAGVPLKSTQDVPKVISHFKAGDTVNIRILRNKRSSELLVRLW
jgi:serine protease Do